MSRPRALFFGTPAFAVPCLSVLAELCEVTLVITQPDRPSGRGLKLAPPPVKVRAEELGIRVIQPVKVRTPEFAAELVAERADIAVVVAYGRILTRAVLAAPRLGCVNVHASLLPKWRGAAPIQWAVTHGDDKTGVCLMQMDEGLDTGAVYARSEIAIGKDELASELAERLSELGASLVRDALPKVLARELIAVPQDHEQATLAPILDKSHGRIDWRSSSLEIHNLARGMTPWPSAFTSHAGGTLKIHRTAIATMDTSSAPGTVVSADRNAGLVVACGSGALSILELQPEGKRRMSFSDFLAGRGIAVSDILGAAEAS